MLKILQARLQQYMNRELPDGQAGFRKGRGTRDQIANICWIIKKAREFQKNIYFCFIDYAKAFDCVDHNKLWEILKDDASESAALNMPANLENSSVATGLEKVSFHFNLKERQCQRMHKLPHNCTHLTSQQSNAQNCKVMLKLSMPRFNCTWIENFQKFKLELEKAEEPEIKLPTYAGS